MIESINQNEMRDENITYLYLILSSCSVSSLRAVRSQYTFAGDGSGVVERRKGETGRVMTKR